MAIKKYISTKEAAPEMNLMSGLEAFQQMRKMAENGQFPEMTLDEINEEIRLAREERRKRGVGSLPR